MRHNQNARRGSRGRGGGGNHHHSGNGHHNHQGRRMNPRVQVFDSNGPEVRIRGTAYQINEKYVALARDAAAAGDRVLAESYLQHAEHYQRFINEMAEEFSQQQPQNPQGQQQPHISHYPQPDETSANASGMDGQAQPTTNSLEGGTGAPPPALDGQEQQPRHERQRHHRNRGTAAAAAAPASDAETT